MGCRHLPKRRVAPLNQALLLLRRYPFQRRHLRRSKNVNPRNQHPYLSRGSSHFIKGLHLKNFLGQKHLHKKPDLNAVFRNGFIWTTHHVANDADTKTEVAWYQIDPANASPSSPYGTPTQQGRISDTSRWYYYPSIAVNSNDDVGIGFSGSSSSEYAGAYYTARQSSDTANTISFCLS